MSLRRLSLVALALTLAACDSTTPPTPVVLEGAYQARWTQGDATFEFDMNIREDAGDLIFFREVTLMCTLGSQGVGYSVRAGALQAARRGGEDGGPVTFELQLDVPSTSVTFSGTSADGRIISGEVRGEAPCGEGTVRRPAGPQEIAIVRRFLIR